MFHNVLVGVDGKEGGRDAIALAKLLLAPDGELTLAHIYHGDPYQWHGPGDGYDAALRERASELLLKAREQAGGDVAIRWRASSSPGRGLHELAEEIGADLLVIGSSPRGLLHRVLVGDHVHQALDGAPCAVALAPAGFSERTVLISEIGVGYDGSPESEHALAVARQLAAEYGARLSAFEALALPTYLAHLHPGRDGSQIEDLVDRARELIAALGGVEAHAAYGFAGEELALYGASLDLLVIGSRGYGPLGRLLHGSTARALARSARCPVLVLPRAVVPPPAAGQKQDAALSAAGRGATGSRGAAGSGGSTRAGRSAARAGRSAARAGRSV